MNHIKKSLLFGIANVVLCFRGESLFSAVLAREIDGTKRNEDNLYALGKRGDMGKVRVLADGGNLKLCIDAGVDFAVPCSLLVKGRREVKAFVKAPSETVALARRDRARSA